MKASKTSPVPFYAPDPNGTSPADFQKDWDIVQQKLPEETPQPGDDPAVIQQKAQAWANRILLDYSDSVNSWGARYSGAIAGVEAIHPKFSPGIDGETFQWTGYNVTVTVLGSEVDPDEVWFEYTGAWIPPTNTVAVPEYAIALGHLVSTMAHEIAHSTQASFPRDLFGLGDHTPISAPQGLMRPGTVGIDEDFSLEERKILRGIVP